MAGKMCGAKGMRAAKMKGRFGSKDKKKASTKGERETPSEKAEEIPEAEKLAIKKRMLSETY